MKRYPVYRNIGSGWIDQLPAHWEAKAAKYACSYNDDVISEDTSPDTLIQYIEISDVDEITGMGEGQILSFKEAPSRARRRAKAGDVVVSTVRTYLRAVAAVTHAPENLVLSTGFAVLRPQDILPSFARYALVADGFVGSVIARSTGVSYPAINASDLVRIPVPVPPPAEQAAIASYLDTEVARIDALVAEKVALVNRLDEFKVATALELATRGLDPGCPRKPSGIAWAGDVPQHWHVKRNMFLFRRRHEEGIDGLPILKVSLHSGVSEGEDDDEGVARLRKQMEDKTSYQIARQGDVAYNMMRAWQGAIGAVPIDGLVSPAYVVLLPTEELDARYFEMLARTPGYKKDCERYSYGIASFRWRLYWEGFKEIRTPLPPLAEQRAIVSKFYKLTTEVDALIQHVEREVELLRELRSSTITDAVLGRIDLRADTSSESDAREPIV